MVNIKDIKSDNSVQLTGLEFGYYLVDEITDVEGTHSAGSICMVSTANPSAGMQVKSDYPSVIKKIQEDDQNPNLTDPDGWNDIGDYEIGQTVPYKYESNIPNMNGYKNYYYAWHDKMDKALTFKPESVKITISDEKGKSYTLKEGEFTVKTNPGGGDTFQVVVQDMKSIVDKQFPNFNEKQENTYGQKVTLTYEATLNDLAANDTGRPGFENDVRLEFSNDADSNNEGSTGFTPWDTVVCFTYRIDIVKTNDHDKVLQGAHFRLYSDKDCKNEVYVKQGDTGYHVINRDSAGGTDHTGGSQPQDVVEMVSGADGQVILIGLDQGTYWLKETKAPDGYRLLKDPIEIKIIPTYTDDRNNYIKGQGATAETLKELQATAHIKSFYDGATEENDLAAGNRSGTGKCEPDRCQQGGKQTSSDWYSGTGNPSDHRNRADGSGNGSCKSKKEGIRNGGNDGDLGVVPTWIPLLLSAPSGTSVQSERAGTGDCNLSEDHPGSETGCKRTTETGRTLQ